MNLDASLEELMYLIAFSNVKYISDTDKKEQLIQLGTAKAVYEYCSVNPRLQKLIWPLEESKKEIDFIQKHQIKVLSILDNAYPTRLRHCEDAPVILYYMGKGDFQLPFLLSVIGTRSHTRQAFAMIKELIESVRHLPIGIISGLAIGIDTIAHQTALQNKLPTWAVLGHGLDQIYPTQNRKMSIEMLEQGGLFTEFKHKSSPLQFHFPKRNRIVAGMADATLVIETDIKGGSMITATQAFKYNREVFAAPGKIYDPKSRGCLSLIKNNIAQIYHDPIHLLEALQWPLPAKPSIKKRNAQMSFQWDEITKQIIDFIDIHSPVEEAFIQANFAMDPLILAEKLLDLELDGVIERPSGNQYARKID
ncbi:MAG: DNA-protecting protein DprA [Bacteroidota bacterium]|jgi:DNA processing protein